MSQRFKSAREMIAAMDLPKKQTEQIQTSLDQRRMSRMLAVMRNRKKMTQAEAAEKLGWTQGRVSKLESKIDSEISIGDLAEYSQAIGLEMSVMFMPRNMKIVDRVKVHAHEIAQLLKRLVDLSQGDHAMVKGVEHFHHECLANLHRIVGESQKSLRGRKALQFIGPSDIEEMLEEETRLQENVSA